MPHGADNLLHDMSQCLRHSSNANKYITANNIYIYIYVYIYIYICVVFRERQRDYISCDSHLKHTLPIGQALLKHLGQNEFMLGCSQSVLYYL